MHEALRQSASDRRSWMCRGSSFQEAPPPNTTHNSSGVAEEAGTRSLAPQNCTATMIGPSTALCAAHCFYNGGWITSRDITFGANNVAPTAPFGSFLADSLTNAGSLGSRAHFAWWRVGLGLRSSGVQPVETVLRTHYRLVRSRKRNEWRSDNSWLSNRQARSDVVEQGGNVHGISGEPL